MPSALPSVTSEYRPYRRFVAWFMLGISSVGVIYMLAGIAVSIYRQRHVVPAGAVVGRIATTSEIEGCHEELSEVTRSLEKHLESFHTLLDRYEREKAQAWADEGARWRNEWRTVGKRCRFDEVRGGKLSKEIENMAAVHAELGDTETVYSQKLRQFGERDAPRLDRVRERLEKIGTRLREAREKESESK